MASLKEQKDTSYWLDIQGFGSEEMFNTVSDLYGINKLVMEDMFQLTERLTGNKYDSSHEQVTKAILRYSANSELDVVNYYELVLFSFLTGNAGMHLQNFSLLHTPGQGYGLALACDLVATSHGAC
ncbi:MAG: hypothetical protein EOO63_11225 [Hymenobacter sp.]|nr:MAG: hypothetical protein EOO63_11225 [Hymenobacter sp.]